MPAMSAATETRGGRVRVLILLTAALFLLMGVARAWGEFPLNDDWVYAKNAKLLSESGRLTLTGFESAWALSQTLLGAALVKLGGFSFQLLRWSGLLSLLMAAWGCFELLRTAGVRQRESALAALLVVVFPSSFVNGASFMTDTPFLTFWVWALVFLLRVRAQPGPKAIIPACVLMILCIAQRQFGVFLVMTCAAVAASLWLRSRDLRQAGLWLGMATLGGLAVVALLAWWGHQPHLWAVEVQRPVPSDLLKHLLRGWIFLGLLAAPVLPFRSIGKFVAQLPRISRAKLLGVLALSAVLVWESVLLAQKQEWMPYWGNQLSEFGAFSSQLLPDRWYVMLHPWFRMFLSAVGLLGALGLLVQAFRVRVSAASAVVFVASVLYLAGLLIICRYWFDRYLLPLFPAVLLLATLRQDDEATESAEAPSLALFLGLALILAGWTADITYDLFSWNRARWQLGWETVARGLPAEEIAGGYEWEGWFRKPRSPGSVGYGRMGLFQPVRDRLRMGFRVPNGTREVRSIEFARMPWHPNGRLYLYE